MLSMEALVRTATISNYFMHEVIRCTKSDSALILAVCGKVSICLCVSKSIVRNVLLVNNKSCSFNKVVGPHQVNCPSTQVQVEEKDCSLQRISCSGVSHSTQ